MRRLLVTRRIDAVKQKLMRAVAGYRKRSRVAFVWAAVKAVVSGGYCAVRLGRVERYGNGAEIPTVVT